jgi:beta-N-acetylhexosaminidase
MGPPYWRQWLPPLEQVARYGPGSMRLRSTIIAAELRAVGIDVNCAPLGDIAETLTHPFLKNRCYGEDAATVTAAAQAVTLGLREGGVLPVLKHIPGHGRSHVDSHLDVPVVCDDLATLQANDFAPFRALSDMQMGPKMGMTAHLVYTALDAERPATQSPVVVDYMRQELGFDGLLMTDDISMEALGGSLAERARLSRAAGVDLVLHCNGDLPEMEEIASAAGPLDGAGKARAEAALAERVAAPKIDIEALGREFDAQLTGAPAA